MLKHIERERSEHVKVTRPKQINVLIPIASEFSSVNINSPQDFRRRAMQLTDSLVQTAGNRDILLDFTDVTHWGINQVAVLLDSIANILVSHRTVIVGIDPNLANELSDSVYERAKKIQETLEKNDYKSSKDDESEIHHLLPSITDLHQVLLMLDSRGSRYWLGSPDRGVSVALELLIYYPGSLENVLLETKEYDRYACDPPDIDILSEIVQSSRLFFEGFKDGDIRGWKVKLDILDIEAYQAEALINHLKRHLYERPYALRGLNNKEAYLLPHVKEYRRHFVEVARLFQEQEFSRQVGEVMARHTWFCLGAKDPDILVCNTAATILLSNSMRPCFDIMPLIVDVGHYFDERSKEVLQSLDTGKNVVVLQDCKWS